jgi:hypothetical protein
MTTYSDSDGEAHGSKALTWAVIAAAALLLVEVTWPQAMPVAASADAASVQTVTIASHPERVARTN